MKEEAPVIKTASRYAVNPNIAAAPPVRFLFNVGLGIDLVTGEYIKGIHGNYVLNGGMGFMVGIVGGSNKFKSTIARWYILRFLRCFTGSRGLCYDTEMNSHERQWENLYGNVMKFDPEDDLLRNGRLRITDKTVCRDMAMVYEPLKDELEERIKYKIKNSVDTPFADHYGLPLKMIYPTATLWDSFTETRPSNTLKTMSDHDLGAKEGNTIHLQDNLAKTKYFMEMPAIAQGAYDYQILTAHVQKNQEIGAHTPPAKQFQGLPQNLKVSGIPNKSLYMLSSAWHCERAVVLYNSTSDKTPKYPRDEYDRTNTESMDLQEVTMCMLRNKSGGSSIKLSIVCSQSDGVLEGLTNFHRINTNDFGLSGSNTSYALDLMPDTKLDRIKIRRMLDADPLLERACEITSNLYLMRIYSQNPMTRTLWVTPKELYEGLLKRGYDWNVLLKTREWWSVDPQPLPELTTFDLLRMNRDLYHPYWMEKR